MDAGKYVQTDKWINDWVDEWILSIRSTTWPIPPEQCSSIINPWPKLAFFEESSSESDPGTWSFPDSLKKKDFLFLLPNNLLFFGEKDDASREFSELLSIPMATRALESEQKQLMNRLHLATEYCKWPRPRWAFASLFCWLWTISIAHHPTGIH